MILPGSSFTCFDWPETFQRLSSVYFISYDIISIDTSPIIFAYFDWPETLQQLNSMNSFFYSIMSLLTAFEDGVLEHLEEFHVWKEFHVILGVLVGERRS